MNWRIVPWNPKYKLSDTGRMMGPMGLCKPWVGSGLPRAAKYTLSGTGAITVQRAMLKVWDISLEPTREWIVAVCADVRADKEERRAAARRAEKERRQAGAPKPAPVAVPSVEEWRALPQDARYELSNHGRLRGPKGCASRAFLVERTRIPPSTRSGLMVKAGLLRCSQGGDAAGLGRRARADWRPYRQVSGRCRGRRRSSSAARS